METTDSRKFGGYSEGQEGKTLFETPVESAKPYLLIDSLRGSKQAYTDDMTMPTANEDDTLMVMDGASSGDVYIGVSGTVGSTLASFRIIDKEVLSPYVLRLFLANHSGAIKSNNVGSAIPHANKAFITSMLLPTAPIPVLVEAHEMLEPIFRLVKVLSLKNSDLRQTRDLLLPKLISGEVDVSELDIDTGEEAV